jgi:hypothetical protein
LDGMLATASGSTAGERQTGFVPISSHLAAEPR